MVLLSTMAAGYYLYLHNGGEPGPRGLLTRTAPVTALTGLPLFAPAETDWMISAQLHRGDARYPGDAVLRWVDGLGGVAAVVPPSLAPAAEHLDPLLNGEVLVAHWPQPDDGGAIAWVLVLGVNDGPATIGHLQDALPAFTERVQYNGTWFSEGDEDAPAAAVYGRYLLLSPRRDAIRLAIASARHYHRAIVDTPRFQRTAPLAPENELLFVWESGVRLPGDPPPAVLVAGLSRAPGGLAGRVCMTYGKAPGWQAVCRYTGRPHWRTPSSSRLQPSDTFAWLAWNPPTVRAVRRLLLDQPDNEEVPQPAEEAVVVPSAGIFPDLVRRMEDGWLAGHRVVLPAVGDVPFQHWVDRPPDAAPDAAAVDTFRVTGGSPSPVATPLAGMGLYELLARTEAHPIAVGQICLDDVKPAGSPTLQALQTLDRIWAMVCVEPDGLTLYLSVQFQE